MGICPGGVGVSGWLLLWLALAWWISFSMRLVSHDEKLGHGLPGCEVVMRQADRASLARSAGM